MQILIFFNGEEKRKSVNTFYNSAIKGQLKLPNVKGRELTYTKRKVVWKSHKLHYLIFDKTHRQREWKCYQDTIVLLSNVSCIRLGDQGFKSWHHLFWTIGKKKAQTWDCWKQGKLRWKRPKIMASWSWKTIMAWWRKQNLNKSTSSGAI